MGMDYGNDDYERGMINRNEIHFGEPSLSKLYFFLIVLSMK
jgi:hypothetical protein